MIFVVWRYGALWGPTHAPYFPSQIIPKNTKTHPPYKHDVIIERLSYGFSINLQGKKQAENKICY